MNSQQHSLVVKIKEKELYLADQLKEIVVKVIPSLHIAKWNGELIVHQENAKLHKSDFWWLPR